MAGTSEQRQAADIGRQQVGAVYGKALLGTLEKQGVTDEVLGEFESLVSQVLDRFPNFNATLSSPRLSVDEKTRLLDQVFGSRVSNWLLNFLKVVCVHGRLDCLREICTAARAQLNERRGIVPISLLTADPIAEELAGQISSRLQASLKREVQLRRETHADLIGGLIVRVGDKVFDGSVRNQLSQLRAQTLEKTIQEMRSQADRFSVVS